jgi:5'-nucleotidase
MKDDIDVIVSGHTHRAYNCTFGKKLVTSAAAFGRIITTIDLSIDKTTDDVVSKSARNVIVTRDVPPAPEQTAILNHYRPFYEPLAKRTVGTISQDLSRTQNAAGESPLGDVIADAFLEATRDNAGGLAVIAFINPGGIRADLTRQSGMAPDAPSPVSFSDVFNVFPFQNRLIVKTFTGETIRAVLEQQFDNRAVGNDMVLQVSNGFTYSYDRTKPKGQRVDPASMMLNGRPIDPRQRYRVAMPDFLGEGGDNFTELTRGNFPVLGVLDSEAFSAYLARHAPAVPGPMNRITRTR